MVELDDVGVRNEVGGGLVDHVLRNAGGSGARLQAGQECLKVRGFSGSGREAGRRGGEEQSASVHSTECATPGRRAATARDGGLQARRHFFFVNKKPGRQCGKKT
jgi:hypothetical protein